MKETLVRFIQGHQKLHRTSRSVIRHVRKICNLKNYQLVYAYHLRSGWASLPSGITFYPTYKCNLRCKMCPIWGGSVYPAEKYFEEMSLTQIRDCIDDVVSFKPSFYLTGGEPFLRKDIVEIITHIKQKGLQCAINTNGTLITKSIARALVELAVDKIIFSIDGTNGINDEIRGLKGGYKKAINALEMIKHEKGQNKKPITSINFVVSTLNYQNMKDMVDVAAKLGVSIQFQLISFLDDEKIQQSKEQFKELFPTFDGKVIDGFKNELHSFDVDLLWEEISKTKQLAAKLNVNSTFFPDLNKDALKKYFDDLNFVRTQRCTAPWKTVRILPNGDVSPCLRLSMGNVTEQRFMNIWNNAAYKHFRVTLKKYGFFPICVRCCRLWE